MAGVRYPNPERKRILQMARKYILRREFDTAIREYLNLLGAFPDDKKLSRKLGDLHLRAKNMRRR